MSGLAFSQACENNKQAILSVIKPLFTGACQVLEVGSGTGQHGEFFARMMPELTWQLADQMIYHEGLEMRRQLSGLDNLFAPLSLDVNEPWPITQTDHLFSANTVHIMSWPEVELLFTGIASVLADGGALCLYGPFNYGGEYTSDSNAEFDQWLKARDPASGIRDFEAIETLAHAAGLSLEQDIAMPANNRCLVWRKQQRE